MDPKYGLIKTDTLINNSMTMLAVSIYWQMIVIGGVLVSAVALDMLIRRDLS